jgi:hypothetical protein
MWNWISAFGVLIEFVGFGTLACELWQTTQTSIVEAVDLASETSAFDSLVIYDGSDGEPGGAEIIGGAIGKQLDALKRAEANLHERMGLIMRGVVISAVGALLQVIGSFGQALN